ncbi:Uncharacterised protein [Brucella melitensis]|nr:Uncharacterised protein [Brucella melitensis]
MNRVEPVIFLDRPYIEGPRCGELSELMQEEKDFQRQQQGEDGRKEA